MAIDPKHLLEFAKLLANNANDLSLPPHIREAATRDLTRTSYYACYHIGLDFAKKRGYKPLPGAGCHDSLWRWYNADPNTIDIATTGKALKAKRVDADYKLTKPAPVPLDVLGEADDFVNLLIEERDRIANSGEVLQRAITWPPPKPPKKPRTPKK